MLVVIAIIGTLAGILVPAVQVARESARKSHCQNNLKQIGLAIVSYESVYKNLPAAAIRPAGYLDEGRQFPFTTWSIAILPMIEGTSIAEQFDNRQSIDSEPFARFRTTRIPTLLCPSDAFNSASEFESMTGVRFARANYAANYGAASWGATFWKQHEFRGVMGQNSFLRLGSIIDGLSTTIAVSELLAHPNRADNRGVWAFHAPGSSMLGLDCDMQCQGINGDPVREWIPFCAFGDSILPCNFQNNAFSNAGPRSLHAGGGAQMVSCDGSVRFWSQRIDTNTLVAIFTSSAAETVAIPD
ncbi:DUF1559 domain-containing protein [Pirellula sp. SH-Sr6A]|uniref:DUF1559 domain-containing protein n=1 Tax=Pirellula sp. SH-Sr6A TaxID=1632865 RepID=UPI001F0A80DA|nr:DUF1559 domain-containing protein [Pirellula sp. SH-Sr6A]